MPYIGRLDAFRERASVANPTVRDYLGTLAVNLTMAAEAAEELRADASADLRVAMGLERVNAMTIALEDHAVAFRAQIADARRALTDARKQARAAIDAAQAARREVK